MTTDLLEEIEEIEASEKPENKADKEKASKKLLDAIAQNRIKTKQEQVAFILSHNRMARNSDHELYVQFLKTFYPNHIDIEGRIHLDSLKEIPKQYDIQRMRAKIQNDYKLFPADPQVRRYRKIKEEEAKEQFVSEGKRASNVTIYSDESGKSDKFLVIGSYWVYDQLNHDFLEKRFGQWRITNGVGNKEFHFRATTQHEQAKHAFSFFQEAVIQSQMNSFMALIVERKGIPIGRLSKAVYDGFAELVINGIRAEFESRRITPPIRVSLCKDAEEGTDDLELVSMKRRMFDGIRSVFTSDQVKLEDVESLDSAGYNLIQVADLFTSTVSRWINQGEPTEGGNPRNQLARDIGDLLGYKLQNEKLSVDGDFCKILYLSDVVEVSKYFQ